MNKKQAQEQFDVVLEKINNLTTEAEKLKAIIDAPRNNVWEPIKGEKFFYLSDDGVIFEGYWHYTRNDAGMYSVGNCFRTKEEATFERDRKIFMTKLRRWALNNNDDEITLDNGNQALWALQFNRNNGSIFIDVWSVCQFGLDVVYFTSKKLAKQAIEEFGESDIKKYMFGATK